MEKELHVTFGAGRVGTPLAARLLEAGKRVRIVKHSAGTPVSGAEVILGDAADPAFCRDAAKGAIALYHCMNPPYETSIWAELVPRYMENPIAAAGKAGARLVALDNFYMLGRTGGRPMNEDTPMNSPSPERRCGRRSTRMQHVPTTTFPMSQPGSRRCVARVTMRSGGPGCFRVSPRERCAIWSIALRRSSASLSGSLAFRDGLSRPWASPEAARARVAWAKATYGPNQG
jgi:hypothetical protein